MTGSSRNPSCGAPSYQEFFCLVRKVSIGEEGRPSGGRRPAASSAGIRKARMGATDAAAVLASPAKNHQNKARPTGVHWRLSVQFGKSIKTTVLGFQRCTFFGK